MKTKKYSFRLQRSCQNSAKSAQNNEISQSFALIFEGVAIAADTGLTGGLYKISTRVGQTPVDILVQLTFTLTPRW